MIYTVDFAIATAFDIIILLLYVFGVPLFIYRRHTEPIRGRGWLLAVLQISYLVFDCAIRQASRSSTNIPCFLTLFDSIALMPLWIYPYFIRYTRGPFFPSLLLCPLRALICYVRGLVGQQDAFAPPPPIHYHPPFPTHYEWRSVGGVGGDLGIWGG